MTSRPSFPANARQSAAGLYLGATVHCQDSEGVDIEHQGGCVTSQLFGKRMGRLLSTRYLLALPTTETD